MKKIFLFLIFSSFVFCNQNEKPEIEIIDNSIDNSNEENKIYENNDFLKIQLQKHKNVREFYYFSRWHKYLREVEEENYRKKEYENAMKLIKTASKMLNEAEGRLIKVIEKNGEIETEEI